MTMLGISCKQLIRVEIKSTNLRVPKSKSVEPKRVGSRGVPSSCGVRIPHMLPLYCYKSSSKLIVFVFKLS